MDAPAYVARGQRVGLGPLRTDLAEQYARWVNDVEVKAGIMTLGVFNPNDEVAFVTRMQAEGATRDPVSAHFTIYDLADDHPVGMGGLFDVSWRHRRAELGIQLGERRGTGLGGEAVRLIVDWGFNVLSLNNVMLGYIDYNDRGRRAYERAGFKLVGRRREAILAGGRLRDEVLMDITAADFGESQVAARELPR